MLTSGKIKQDKFTGPDAFRQLGAAIQQADQQAAADLRAKGGKS